MIDEKTLWEYCQIYSDAFRKSEQKFVGGIRLLDPQYTLKITYIATTGEVNEETLVKEESGFTQNPFHIALGLLAGAGWELMSVQHGNLEGGTFQYLHDVLIPENAIAWLKRPALPGRPVNSPEISLHPRKKRKP